MMNKMMKKAAVLFSTVAMALSATCVANAASPQKISPVEPSQKVTIEPLWLGVIDENGNPFDGRFSASLDTATIKDVDGGFTIEAQFYGEDNYNLNDVMNMKKGDTILCDGKIVTVNTIDQDKEGNILVNGGYEKDGITMVPTMSGSFETKIDNDYHTHEKIAEGTVFVSDKTVLTDKSNLDNKDGAVYTGAKEIKDFMGKTNISMNCFNTTLAFANGELTEIAIHYTP